MSEYEEIENYITKLYSRSREAYTDRLETFNRNILMSVFWSLNNKAQMYKMYDKRKLCTMRSEEIRRMITKILDKEIE